MPAAIMYNPEFEEKKPIKIKKHKRKRLLKSSIF